MMQFLPAVRHVRLAGGALIHLVPLTSVGFEAATGTTISNVSSTLISGIETRLFIVTLLS
jgi:hypothetical protein